MTRDLARSSPRRRRPRRAAAAAGRAGGATTARAISRRTISTCADATSSTSAARPVLRRALDYFQQAAEKDSMFARAYAGIAERVRAFCPLYANVRVDSLMPLALKAINRAVGLDSTLA